MSMVIFAPDCIAVPATFKASPTGSGYPLGRCCVPGGG